MQPTPERPFSLQDFEPVIQTLLEDEATGVVIGGMAVSAWAEIFILPEEKTGFDLPIFSKDLDLRGTKSVSSLLMHAMKTFGADPTNIVAATRKAAPHMGRIFAVGYHWKGARTTIEVLERLPGLDSSLEDAPVGSSLAISRGISLLDPCSLFICKLHAANTRPGEGANNDAKHLAILARVIPRFLEKVRVTALPEYDAREDAERLLRRLESCLSGNEGWNVPLPAAELEKLLSALRQHLA
jgi:hypothetical protein